MLTFPERLCARLRAVVTSRAALLAALIAAIAFGSSLVLGSSRGPQQVTASSSGDDTTSAGLVAGAKNKPPRGRKSPTPPPGPATPPLIPTSTPVSPTATRTPAPASTSTSPAVAATRTATVPPTNTSLAATPTRTPSPVPTSTPEPSPANGAPRLLFGLGSQPDGAMDSPLNLAAPLGMYSSWYNKSEDLDWMRYWGTSGFIANEIYGTGRAAHLIIWSDVPETGTPCGRPYPISDRINADMVELAQIWAGPASGPPLYVTLFTEFQTFPCIDNQWSGAEAYYTKLQEKMVQIKDIFHTYAPNSRVSIGWGGWQLRWDNPAEGEGRSLLPHFDDVMQQMDFQSFQAMHDSGNVNDVRQMSEALGAYGPVMMAHYKPQSGSDAVFFSDVSVMMTDSFLAEVTGYGLFAWSFMDEDNIDDADEAAAYQLVRDSILRYGRSP